MLAYVVFCDVYIAPLSCVLKWIQNSDFACWMLRGSSVKRALLLLLQCIGTNLDQDLSADVVFGSLFSSSCQQYKIKLSVRRVEMYSYCTVRRSSPKCANSCWFLLTFFFTLSSHRPHPDFLIFSLPKILWPLRRQIRYTCLKYSVHYILTAQHVVTKLKMLQSISVTCISRNKCDIKTNLAPKT